MQVLVLTSGLPRHAESDFLLWCFADFDTDLLSSSALLADGFYGPKVKKQIVLDGPVSCGKSIALAMLVQWAREEGWLTELWDTPVQAAEILKENWPCVLLAMAGGVFLSLGNLSTQYAWAFVGLLVTEVVTSSITVVIGTTLNYFLDDRINKAEILFPGFGFFLIAVFLGAAVHSSNGADNKAKLSSLSKDNTDEAGIEAFIRGYLARKALCALKGLVKLQALVRGYLVRKQAARTLRCMQSLVTVQARARAQRNQMAEETHLLAHTSSNYRNLLQANHIRPTYNMDRHIEDNVKVVEMDFGQSRGSTKSRNSYLTNDHVERADQRYSPHHYTELKQNCHCHMLLAKMSPNACSRHFDDYSVRTEQSSSCHNSSVSKPDPSLLSIFHPCIQAWTKNQRSIQ
ncbi:hypothetical protein IFM89_020106 [Coptis chinensis]|uniref:Uncharacterized protein n=1 Tax=Coptis chinensis TaxID=261450 RepID=A0A835HFW9_9MAGN|nr:hypothetical protein IFM89_020106 [Coptis chinensis]